MSPEVVIVLLLSAVGGGGGVAAWRWRARQRQYVARVQSDWVREGHIIHAAPVDAICYGLHPRRIYRHAARAFGALGLTGDQLVFSGMTNNRYDLRLPYADVKLIALRTIRIRAGKTTTRARALVVHFESVQGWQTAVFQFQAAVTFAATLAHECHLSVYDAGQDYGPTPATQMTQDVYGEWSGERRGDLYLIADRLIFDRRDAIRLADLQRVDVIERPSLNPFAPDLLRLEYVTADGEPVTTGYVVRGAQRWADAIARQREEPLIVHSGRKKK